MQEERNRGSYIGQAWLVILLAALYGVALAGVQSTLSGKIEQNKKAETYEVMPDLVPGAEPGLSEELTVMGKDGQEVRLYRAVGVGGRQVGWLLPAGGQGFGDRIEILIGVDTQVSTITGLYVLEQKETPGLGDYITSADFQSRFQGKPADRPLVIVKSEPQAENEVHALTGATISSESVAAIVNTALANCKEPILLLAGARSGGRQSTVEPGT